MCAVRAADGLVVDVGDVADKIGIVPGQLEQPVQDIETDEGQEIADVRGPVDGRPAHVQPELPGAAGGQLARFTAQGVVQANRFHRGDQRIWRI